MKEENIPATPKNLRNARRMIWGGFIAGTLFIILGEVVNGIMTNTFISFSPYFITFLVLSILSLIIIAQAYHVILITNHKNPWWLLPLIPLTAFVMFFASDLLYGFIWLLLTAIGSSVFQFYF
jgi:hypothetical protein